MIEQQGRVLSIEGDRAWVGLGGQSGCAACDSGKGCGAGVFGRLLNRSEARVPVPNRLALSPGDPVLVGLEETALLGLVMKLYGWPLLAGLGAATAMQGVLSRLGTFSPGTVDLAVGTAGLVVGGLVLRAARRGREKAFTTRSLEMLDPVIDLDCRSFDRNP